MSNLVEQFGMEMVDLDGLDIPSKVTGMISKTLCQKLTILPIDLFEEVLTVAISDPMNLGALDELRSRTKCQVEPILAPE